MVSDRRYSIKKNRLINAVYGNMEYMADASNSVCRQNGHFLFGVFYGSICKEETRYDDRKAEE